MDSRSGIECCGDVLGRESMNREILFRGKQKDNGEWVYGCFVDLIDGKRKIPCIYGKGEVIHKTVGQYTGLTDKNGKKIFEGDIVRYSIYPPSKYEYGVVNWFNGGFRAGDTNCNLCVCSADGVATYKLEVIGNIHDNPELMEGENESGFNKHKA